jgi:aldehyde dehydrogenase (NAD+)
MEEIQKNEYDLLIDKSTAVHKGWRKVPAPKRGDLIRIFGNKLREHLDELGKGVTMESKKPISEGIGEVQEAIDMCDFAVGLSRQLYGLTMPSERVNHRLQEMWHPLGVVGCITAFNFPVAPWAWNFCLAIVCGDSVVWKPSPKTIKISYRCKEIFDEAVNDYKSKYVESLGIDPKDLLLILEGGNEPAEWLAEDKKIKLLSATGSCEMGKSLAPKVAARMGKGLYELGGNNAAIVTQHADLTLAGKAIAFSVMGTTGQRCTSLRRLYIQKNVYRTMIGILKEIFGAPALGDPMVKENVLGPLISKEAVDKMQKVIKRARQMGYDVWGGEETQPTTLPKHEVHRENFVFPCLIEPKHNAHDVDLAMTETFAPILYTFQYDKLPEAIEMQNSVPQGLSSCIFTEKLIESEQFISAVGSDCGIVNVNIGPSGAEIGGAFGGEKDTGGGRESGSDAWKQYMRRTTVTINYGRELNLAQGIKFETGN